LEKSLPFSLNPCQERKLNNKIQLRFAHIWHVFLSVQSTLSDFRAGLEGRSCIKRALCETAQRLMPQSNILEEILRVLFSYVLNVNRDAKRAVMLKMCNKISQNT
jgi:hypothetical protein